MGDSSVMPLSAFDDIDRNLEGAAPELLSQFDYLNTSNREEARRVRLLVDDLLSRFPTDAQGRLRDRLRSIDDVAHEAAFFELALHEFLLRGGCRIVSVEPEMARTKRSPDFLVAGPNGEMFFLEATLATGRSSEQAGKQKLLEQVFKTLNGVHSTEFFLSVSHHGMPQRPIAGRKLAGSVFRWLASLSYDAIVAAYDSDQGQTVPRLAFEEHGLRLVISPVPRRRSRGTESPGRSIAVRMLNSLTVQPQVPIRDAVKGKASRYGNLNLPYVVAVNAMSDYANEDSVIDALFGTPGVTVRMVDGQYIEKPARQPDGVWRNGTGAINTRVSAVLSMDRLTPWSVGQRRARLIVNPWAKFAFPSLPLNVDLWQPVNDELKKSNGRNFAEMFGLPSGWPE